MKKATQFIGISSTILLLFLFSTDPQKIPSFLLIVPFVLFFAILTGLFAVGLRLVGGLGKKEVKIGAVIAAAPVSLLVLQSLGQLTIRDVLAILALFVVAYFYLSRVGSQSANRL